MTFICEYAGMKKEDSQYMRISRCAHRTETLSLSRQPDHFQRHAAD